MSLGTRRRWVISFTLRPLYLQGISLGYLPARRVGGSKSWSGRGGVEKNLWSCRESNPNVQHVGSRITDWTTPAHPYLYNYLNFSITFSLLTKCFLQQFVSKYNILCKIKVTYVLNNTPWRCIRKLEVEPNLFLTSLLGGNKGSNSNSGRLSRRESFLFPWPIGKKTPKSFSIWSWRAKYHYHRRGSTTGLSVRIPIFVSTSL